MSSPSHSSGGPSSSTDEAHAPLEEESAAPLETESEATREVGSPPPQVLEEPVVGDSAEDVVPAACRGTSLDLPTVFTNDECRTRGETLVPDTLLVLIEAPVVTTVSGRGETNVVLRNPTARPLEVRLRYACGMDAQISLQVHRGSERVDETGTECGHGRGCGSRLVRLVLESGGEARFPVEVTTAVRVIDEQCQPHPGAPLARGDYTLSTNVLFLRQEFETPLHVR